MVAKQKRSCRSDGGECECAAIEGPLTWFGNAKTDSAALSETGPGIAVEASTPLVQRKQWLLRVGVVRKGGS